MAALSGVRKGHVLVAAAVCCLMSVTAARADTLSGKALVDALQKGGYVLVMRHASSPMQTPTAETADAENFRLERQLDEQGRATATAMGKAIRALHIPIVDVISSPTYRARQTALLAGFGEAMTFRELGEGKKGMQAKAEKKKITWLRKRTEELPPKGTDTLVVTHTPNIVSAFGEDAAGIASGETLIFKPDGKGKTVFVGRIKIETWPQLAATE